MYDEYTLIAYGCGKWFFPYMERLDKLLKIDYFCDKNNLLWGKRIYGDSRKCLSPEELKTLKNPLVIFTLDDLYALSDAKKYLEAEGIPYKCAKDVLEIDVKDKDAFSIYWPEIIQRDKIHRFIDINLVGTTSCNLHCEYCYVWRRLGFHGENKLSNHSVDELCEGLSIERTGGSCFINMCARGETLLADGIIEFTIGLLQQGHYVSIVTNATITKRIEEILCFSPELLKRLFFKISFHYKELKRLSLIDVFWHNVEAIKNSKCSYTLEITPGDGTEALIEEIKEMCIDKMQGVQPHISFTRDSKKIGYDLLSEHPIETYRDIWGQFDSKMFDLKSEWYGKNMRDYICYAGAWSYLVNAMTGEIKACYQRQPIGNIFDKEMKAFPVKAVGKDCCIAYCFNNHAFLAWGCVPEINCSSYLDMRDREFDNGEHWVKEPVYSFMQQKLEENNYEYIDKWSDYEKLYEKDRKKAFILFNSPDYPNLGDHAIALAEKRFFLKYFEEYDFIEISCTQYMKENPRIKPAIRQDDVLVVTGGGNSGDCYLRLQDMITHIVQNYHDNIVIIAPQSMYFNGGKFSDVETERVRVIYEKHNRLLVMAREEKTYQLYMSLFSDSIKKIKAPDMAFFLEYKPKVRGRRHDALVCMRNDKESQGIIDKEKIENALGRFNLAVEEYSTISHIEVFLDNREKEVFEALNTISEAKIVITDRLHCMIFCVITDTPCVVFDNATGKVFTMLEWLPTWKKVIPCRRENEIEETIQKALEIKQDSKDTLVNIHQEFENLAVQINKFVE